MRTDSDPAELRGDLAAGLTAHLKRAAREPYAWGSLNCWFWVADWIALRTGVDPALAMRGRFESQFGARRWMLRHNARSYLELAERAARACGLAAIHPTKAKLGDVGAVLTAKGHHGVICAGRRWAAKTVNGFAIGAVAPRHLVRTWMIEP